MFVLAPFVAVYLTLSQCGQPVRPCAPRERPAAADTAALEVGALALANAERTSRGLPPLTPDPLLTAAARQHSREMSELGYFDHESPSSALRTPSDRYQWFGGTVEGSVIGENLFYGNVTDAAWGHRSLMQSAPHRENLLSRSYTRAGVGVYVSPAGEMWLTEMFAGPSARSVTVRERLVAVAG